MPRALRAVELFLSLGLAAATAGGDLLGAEPVQAQHQHPTAHSQTATSGEGGEGGEGGSQAVTNTEEQLAVLAQMQGHLLVAEELLKRGDAQGAEPHTGHPVDELYGALEPAIASGQLPPFRDALETLRQQVRLNPGSAATNRLLLEARQAIAAASNRLSPSFSHQPALVLTVVRQLAMSAANEYQGAVDGLQIRETIEYQDARGFLLQADQLLKQASTGSAAGSGTLQPSQQRITAMLRAFPTSQPPQRAVLSAAALSNLAKGI